MARTPPQNFQHEFPDQSVSFDPAAFDRLIQNQGVRVIHFKAMRCPAGLQDITDVRRPHEHHQDCSNGFLYRRAGVATMSFLGNSGDNKLVDVGRLDGSNVAVSFPRFYDDNAKKRIDLLQFDRVYLDDQDGDGEPIVVTNWELFAANALGVDRLQFPVVDVEFLEDSRGKEYRQDQDFEVTPKGFLKWIGNGPGVDPKTNKGVVCSVRYSYKPFWYVKNLVHELRFAQVSDGITGARHLEVLAQQANLQREYFYHSEERDPEAPNVSGRQAPQPPSGSFGVR